MSGLRHFYTRHPTAVVYMLQSTEYQVGPYLRWYWRTDDFSKIMHRRTLDPTRRAQALRWLLRGGMGLQVFIGLTLIMLEVLSENYTGAAAFGTAVLVSYPVIWAHLIVIPLLLAKYLIVEPKDIKAIAASEKLFADHTGAKIAVLGSYGKTTMKELLTTILSAGIKVAATPGNKNVSTSHAAFARGLAGDEKALIIEYGEGKPGDIDRFAKHTHPTHAIITGVAAAHLDAYKTVDSVAKDIFSIKDYVPPAQLYANAESPEARPFIDKSYQTYSSAGLDGWKVSDVAVSLDGTAFTLKNGKQTLKLHSGLLGRHQIGPLTAAVVLALELGLKTKDIETGVAATKPFEHRLQPYHLGGAWIIDDTYNGNLEGVRAGTALLGELQAKRKWYVTPGLVDQGSETAKIHQEAGRLIAAAKPDIVVLMQNSVAKHIQAGLESAEYKGEVRIEKDPLDFYTNLDQFIAKDDLVLMQNDWTDNYA